MKPISFRRMLALANTLRNVAKSQKEITLGTLKALGNGKRVRLPKIATVFVPKAKVLKPKKIPKPRYVRKTVTIDGRRVKIVKTTDHEQ
ncbi:MAG: hypothetical protein WCS70_14070 [Verrucomicrobiota bacterium]